MKKRTAALGVAFLALAGCASGTTAAGPSSPTPRPAVVVLDEHADRTTVQVGIGTTIRVELHSTYWSDTASSAPKLVRPTGTASASAAPSCHPGGGCGTVTSTFVAGAAGSAQLSAQRTVCGEARNCPPDQRTFTVTVDVRDGAH